MKNSHNLLSVPISGLEAIKNLLPHRNPMIMVDALTHFTEKSAISTLCVFEDNIFVKEKKLSETGLLEHMAQTAALHAGYKMQNLNSHVREGFIASIKTMEIFSLPLLQQTIQTEMEMLFEMPQLSAMKFQSFVNGKLIAKAEMNTVLKVD